MHVAHTILPSKKRPNQNIPDTIYINIIHLKSIIYEFYIKFKIT